VTALIRGLRDTGALFRSGGAWILGDGSMTAVPRVMRDLVLARLERLGPAERALLELIVVAGDVACPAVLGRVGGQQSDELDAALRRLGESGLLVEEPGPSDIAYRATHPLVAEVAYAELQTIRRRRLHARVAQALEALDPSDVQRLAHHYLGAGGEADPRRALDVLVAAAARAEEMHADAEAAEQLAAALALARVNRPVVVEDLLERLGHARSRTGRLDAAVAAWSEAAGGRERAGDRPASGRLRGLLALAEWDRGRFEAATAQLAAGLAAVEGTGADAEVVDLHYIRLRLLMRQADLAGLEEEATILLALAGNAGPRQAKAAVAAHLARAEGAFMHGRLTVAAEHGLQALDVAERAGLPAVAAVAHRFLAVTYVNAGDQARARQHTLGELGLVQRIGSPILEAAATFVHLSLDLAADDWEGVLRSADEMLATGHRIGAPRAVAAALVGRAYVLAHRGDLEEAARSVTEARDVYGAGAAVDRHLFTVVEIADAAVALAAGEPERARTLAVAALATPTTLPCLGLSILGESQVAAGDPSGALETARRLVDLGPEAPWPAACGRRIEGLARAAAGERSAALACLEQAAVRLGGLGLPFQAARAWLDWAEVAAAVPSNDAETSAGWADVTATARRSLADFDRLGARPFADRARRLLRAAGERPPARARLATGELSERELQVVGLVAAGLSNIEIAERLFISQRTVTTHLQHVYRRLGLQSRTALTRWVLERGPG
ncbi:MAG TPA: LuxR C-terminal-related transcriptional regulator, partial [Nakamurella sp.]